MDISSARDEERVDVQRAFTWSRVALGGRWKIWCGVGRAVVGYGYGFALDEACRCCAYESGVRTARARRFAAVAVRLSARLGEV